MSVRNYEAVVGAIKALNESIPPCTASFSSHQPYDLPISQLLRFEKTRGFEDEHNTTKLQLASRYQYDAVASSTPAQHRLSDAWPSQGSVNVTGGSRSRSSRRHFSSHSARERPPPVKKPHLPPRRIPSIAARVAPAPVIDDVLSRISELTTTGEEHNRKIENEQARLQKRQTREIIEKGPWWDKFRSIEFRAKEEFPSLNDGPLKAVDYIQLLKQNARKEGLQRLENAYNRTERTLKRYIAKSEAWDRKMASLEKDMEERMAAAKEEGRLDFRVEQHLIKSGLRSLEEDMDHLSTELLHARTRFAEYWYNFELNKWKRNLIEEQLKYTQAATGELKEDGGIHHHTIEKFKEITIQSETIAKVLRRLEIDMNAVNGLRQPQPMSAYRSMLAVPYYFWFESYFMSAGHYWRKTNRLNLIAARMPELVKHSLIEIEVSALSSNIKDNLEEIYHLMRFLMIKKWSERRRITFIRAHEAYGAYQHGINRILADYIDFSKQGLIMLNPAMSSTSGLLKYAALSPFYAYVSALQSTESALRYVISMYQRMNHDMDGSSARIEWRTKVIQWLKEQSDVGKLPTRTLIKQLTGFTYEINARIIEADWTQEAEWPFLRNLSTRIAEKAEKELQEIAAFEKLSIPDIYRKQDDSKKLVDPFRMKGRGMLYPPKNAYPVEYIASEQGIVRILNEFMHSKILGIELLRTPDAPFPVYAAIANTEKVVILECMKSDHFFSNVGRYRNSLFGQILEDPGIIKIFRNAEVLESLKVGKSSSPKSVVSLDHKKSVRRKAPTQSWPEVFLHHQHQKSVPSFLSDLAFAPVYNLLTFLNAATPSQISGVEQHLKANILEAREWLRRMVAENSGAGLELGNITWKSEEWSQVLGTVILRRRIESRRNLAAIMKEDATKDLERIYPNFEKSDIDNHRDALAAYYMFTTFGQNLKTIKKSLKLDDPADSILSVVQNLEDFNLILHPADEERLWKTPTIQREVGALTDMSDAPADHDKQTQVAKQTEYETQTESMPPVSIEAKQEAPEEMPAFNITRTTMIPRGNVRMVKSSDMSVSKPKKTSIESRSLSKTATRTEKKLRPGSKKEKSASRIAARRKSARRDELSAVPKPEDQGIIKFRLFTGERVSPGETSHTTVVRRVAMDKEFGVVAPPPSNESAIRRIPIDIPLKHLTNVAERKKRAKQRQLSRRKRQTSTEGQSKSPEAESERHDEVSKAKPEPAGPAPSSWKANALKFFGWK